MSRSERAHRAVRVAVCEARCDEAVALECIADGDALAWRDESLRSWVRAVRRLLEWVSR